MLKRIFDIVLSFSGLIILSPLFLIIALKIKHEDSGTVFFIQERIGRSGRKFHLYKFRSMMDSESAQKGLFEPGNMSRLTKTGSKIRILKLDELPQLINVLKGDMSLVGPRPEVEYWVKKFPERWAKIQTIRPGITDKASIEFKNEEQILAKSLHPDDTYQIDILPKKLDIYEEYLKNQSLIGDLKILFQTIFLILKKITS